jgi:hypothetical protein
MHPVVFAHAAMSLQPGVVAQAAIDSEHSPAKHAVQGSVEAFGSQSARKPPSAVVHGTIGAPASFATSRLASSTGGVRFASTGGVSPARVGVVMGSGVSAELPLPGVEFAGELGMTSSNKGPCWTQATTLPHPAA